MYKYQSPLIRFAAVDNETIDSIGCMVTKGLLLTLIRQKPGEDVTVELLTKSHKQGRKLLEASMRDLVERALVVKLRIQSVENNQWRTEFTVSDRPVPAQHIQEWVDGLADARAVLVEPAWMANELDGVGVMRSAAERRALHDNASHGAMASDETAGRARQVTPRPSRGRPVGAATVAEAAVYKETCPVGAPVSRARPKKELQDSSSSSLLRRAVDEDDEAMPSTEKNGPDGPEQQGPGKEPVRLAVALEAFSDSRSASKPSEDAYGAVRAIDWPVGKARPRRDQIDQMAVEMERLLSGGWTEAQILEDIRNSCQWDRIDFPASVVLKNLRGMESGYVPTAQEAAQDERVARIKELAPKRAQQEADIAACTKCTDLGYTETWSWHDKQYFKDVRWCGHGKESWKNDLWALENPEKAANLAVRAGCTNRAHREAGVDPVTGVCVVCQAHRDIPAQQTSGDSEGARFRAQIRARKTK